MLVINISPASTASCPEARQAYFETRVLSVRLISGLGSRVTCRADYKRQWHTSCASLGLVVPTEP